MAVTFTFHKNNIIEEGWRLLRRGIIRGNHACVIRNVNVNVTCEEVEEDKNINLACNVHATAVINQKEKSTRSVDERTTTLNILLDLVLKY